MLVYTFRYICRTGTKALRARRRAAIRHISCRFELKEGIYGMNAGLHCRHIFHAASYFFASLSTFSSSLASLCLLSLITFLRLLLRYAC